MKRMKTAKTLSLLMALMLILQLLPLGTALATDAEDGNFSPATVEEQDAGQGEPKEVLPEGENPGSDGILADTAEGRAGVNQFSSGFNVGLFAAEDQYSWLTNLLTLTITQDGNPISEGGIIDATKPFAVTGNFQNIPLTNASNPYLQKGNYAIFPIDDNVSLAGGASASHDLMYGGVKIGTLKFQTPEGASGLEARIDFGDILWDETTEDGDQKYTTINSLTFNANLQHDGTGIGEGEEEIGITIIGKGFKIHKPAVPIEPTVSKSGSAPDANGFITWKVTVDAKKGTAVNQALKGIKFTDTIGAGHTYVDNTFTVKSSPRNDTDVKKSATSLEYTFIEADGNGPATITYQTQIANWDTVKYGFTSHSFANSAKVELKDKSNTDSNTVTINEKTYIKKTGERVNSNDPLNRQIYWYIEVNEARHSLEDITITDSLNSRLIFKSAQWQKNTAAKGAPAVWSDVGGTVSPTGTNSNQYVYSGVTSEHLRLVILTEATIKEGDYTTDEETFNNTASVTWKDKPGGSISSGNPGVGVGYHALNKSGEFASDWAQSHHVNWTVTVDLKNIGTASIGNFKVYDLLVHGKSGSSKGEKPAAVDTDIWNALTPQYGQKYVEGTLNAAGLTTEHIKVMSGDNHVADLLVISNFTINTNHTITFTSKMLDPSAFTTNGTVTVHNTASLFDGTTHRKDATASPSKSVEVLTKTVLAATDNEDSLTGATGNGTPDSGFNHVYKTAIFRLSINSSGQRLTDTDFVGGTDITVTDTLPEGWVFDQTYNGKGYKIFEGNAATEIATDPVTQPIVYGKNGTRKTVTFTFKTLNAHYVILVKAKLTEDAYAALIAGNTGKVTQTNNVSLTGNDGLANSQASVTVDTGGLSKGSSKLKDGIANWTISYNPLEAKPASDYDKVVIKDTLGPGFEPYLDGSLNMDTAADNGIPRFSIKALGLGINGGLTETGDNLAPSWIAGGKVKYDPATRELSIELPKDKQAYQISYLTILTGAVGTVSNDVKVVGITMHNSSDSKNYQIQNSDASASLGLGGYLRIKKVDKENAAITASATFTLSTSNGRPIRTGTTNASGILRFGALSPNTEANPYYILKETKAPTDYQEDTKEYKVVVTSTVDGIITEVFDGGVAIKQFTKESAVSLTFDVKNWAKTEPRPEYGDLTISKTVVNGKMDKEFTFTINFEPKFDANGTYETIGGVGKADGTITVADNKATFTLKGGESITIRYLPKGAEYTITEDDYTSDGYITTKTGETGEIAANTTHTATFINTIPAPYIPGAAKISVLKTDEDGAKLPGAVFTLYDSTGKAVATAVSNADGIAEFTNVAPNASYTIRETAAPQGYELSNEVISVTTGDGSVHSFTMVNKKLTEDRGSIVITKTDENGVLLPGAAFTLYDADGKAVATAVSDATGTVRFADIPVGSYTIRETAAPEGFVLSTEVLSITLEKDATRSFTFINRRDEVPGGPTGSIGLLKVNNNGERLAGAEFSLYDTDGSLVARAVTGADGIVRFTGLPFGTYSVRETVAPAGYKLFEGAQAVTITAATPDRSFTLRNTTEDDPEVGGWEEIPDEEVPGGPGEPGNKLPQTGGVPQTLFLLLAGLALLSVGLFTLKGQKKQRPAAPGTDE